MRSTGILSVRLIDTVGACLLTLFLAAATWLMLFHNEQTNAQIRELSKSINAARRDASVLEAAQARQREVVAARLELLGETGRLPANAPIEEYFRWLSRLAGQHGLQVIRQHPLSARWYPGLLEQRYAYEVTGSTSNVMRFLKSIEDAPFWADVSHLRVARGLGPEEIAVDQRVASLTLSLFSASLPEATDATEGT